MGTCVPPKPAHEAEWPPTGVHPCSRLKGMGGSQEDICYACLERRTLLEGHRTSIKHITEACLNMVI